MGERKILIVEDEKKIAVTLKFGLDEIGFNVDVVTERSVRTIDEFDDAETVIDRFQQGVPIRSAQRRIAFHCRCRLLIQDYALPRRTVLIERPPPPRLRRYGRACRHSNGIPDPAASFPDKSPRHDSPCGCPYNGSPLLVGALFLVDWLL